MASIQAPSATRTFLASPEDAIILMEAARQCLIPRTTRRLTRTERADLIEDGAVFIFEEQETQMQRWTDGRRWSCSRVMGEFLAYDEVVPCGGPAGRSTQTCRLENGLIKQSFALTLSAEGAAPKKYHIISYSRSLTMHQWKRPSQQPQFSTLDLSLWHTYPPLGAAGPSSSSGSSSSRAASSRSAGIRTASQRPAVGARQKESVSFIFNPDVLSAPPSRGESSTPVASASSASTGCCPPKVEPPPRTRTSQRTRSTSPASAQFPPPARYAGEFALGSASHSRGSGSLESQRNLDRPSSSAAAAVSLLGLGATVKIEPPSTSSALSLASLNGPERSRPPSSNRRSRSPTYRHPYATPTTQATSSQVYERSSVAAYPTFGGGIGRGAPNLFLPHPYDARLPRDGPGPPIAPPPTVRPPWAPSTLDQEDKKMLGRLPFRI